MWKSMYKNSSGITDSGRVTIQRGLLRDSNKTLSQMRLNFVASDILAMSMMIAYLLLEC